MAISSIYPVVDRDDRGLARKLLGEKPQRVLREYLVNSSSYGAVLCQEQLLDLAVGIEAIDREIPEKLSLADPRLQKTSLTLFANER